MSPSSLYLASLGFPGLRPWLEERAGAGPVVLVPDAADGLPDRDAIVEALAGPLRATGRPVEVVGLDDGGVDALRRAAAIAVGGGDPFHLLERLRRSGADRVVVERVGEGVPYVGMSAGAMVAGPSLDPLVGVSPFRPAAGWDPSALGLSEVLVLPHDDAPGRAARHARALRRHGVRLELVPLCDDEVLLDDGGARCVVLGHGRRRWRSARAEDAAGIASVFTAAARAAWSSFLGVERMAAFVAEPDDWAARIDEFGRVGAIRVIEDAEGVAAFAATQPATDADLDPSVGELSLFYAAPRVWGSDAAARLHARVRHALLAAGHDEAVLWTEARNARALAFYRREGWRADGAVRERSWQGALLREARHRVALGDASIRPESAGS